MTAQREKRVGIDARLTRQMSVGMKAYVTELVARLPRVAPEFSYATFAAGANFGWDEQVRLPWRFRRSQVDLVHFTSIYTPLAVLAPSVVTVHDLIHLEFPQYFKAKVRPYYQTAVRLACARARRVITDDERTIDALERFLGVSPSKVRVIPLGVDDAFLASPVPFAAPRPYLLYVGNHRAHKNLTTLFDAWSSLPKSDAVDLYVTGPDDFGGDLQRRSAPERAIVALGDVPAATLPSYYAGARALVQPALREGFGLPMLEAMAAGCAVVACEDAVPRVLEPAALTFAARNTGELGAILHDVIADEGLRSRFVNSGRRIAQTLTWDRCARATADVYGEVL